MPRLLLTGLLLVLAILPVRAEPVREGAQQAAAATRFFETEVWPLFKTHCLGCHGSDKARGGLQLTGRAALLKGGDRGPAVSLDQSEESLLLQAVRQTGELKMPPRGKLAPEQIDVLSRWVKLGAPWSDGVTTAKRAGPPPVDDRARAFWSFRPVTRPQEPKVKNAAWVKTPIDAFVLAKLEAAGLQPAPPAEKSALLRRLTYDLTGLPPSPEEVEDFIKDTGEHAYEKVVDRLLASPHYGEKWGRHWLDLVRYAETNGYEFDAAKPNAWRYRDYVIRSFNDDKPYDLFVKEQIAGDELEKVTPDSIIATGWYRLGPWDSGAPDRLQASYDELDDIVSTAGQAFLGLTVQCARCHDHKIDPFPQKDYYRLLAFFHNIQRYGQRGSQRSLAGLKDQQDQKEQIAEHQKKLAAIAEQMKAIEEELAPKLEAGERDDFKVELYRSEIIRKHIPEHVTREAYDRYLALGRERAALEAAQPQALGQALCVSESGRTPPDTFVLGRGNPRSPGDKVLPGFPSVLTTKEPVLPVTGRDTSSGRRHALAEWIASPENPLTARVLVNRLWQHHFGRGLVRTPSDFGYRGAPPTHPELLDWLASELATPREGEGAWKLKRLHRLMVLSSAYRMSSRPDPAALAQDPENDLLWRFDLRRLSAEEVRDSILAVSGNLNRKTGGPSVYPRLPREVLHGQSMPGVGWGQSSAEEQARRTVYVHVKRSLSVPFLTAFDTADPDASCSARFTTTQPTQALMMLNSDFLNEQAKVFAADLRRRAGTDEAAQVRLALRRVTQREPTSKEIERGVEFMARLKNKRQLSSEEALRSFCLLALNLNEFIYLN
jgi:mono/diheme cytochrome c family protein